MILMLNGQWNLFSSFNPSAQSSELALAVGAVVSTWLVCSGGNLGVEYFAQGLCDSICNALVTSRLSHPSDHGYLKELARTGFEPKTLVLLAPRYNQLNWLV